jgi:ANTAR domain
MLSSDETKTITPRGSNGTAAASLLKISLPKGTPLEAEVAVRRLVELCATLAHRAAQLQEALDSRIAIEQAKGVLAERHGISTDEAFALLRGTARFNRMKLHTLAEEVVASRTTPEAFVRANGGRRPGMFPGRVSPGRRGA